MTHVYRIFRHMCSVKQICTIEGQKKGCLLIDSFSMKQICTIKRTEKECLLTDSTLYVPNICKLCLYGGNNCLPFCHFVLYVNILLQCHNTNAVINSLSTATSAILIGSCELANVLVNGKCYVQPCFPHLQISL